jgi:uncharacterized SAM-binding protein YcdF (DUF218 family)
MEKIKGFLKGLISGITVGFGLMLMLALVLSFTSVPFHWHRWLGEVEHVQPATDPDVILMLGGGGMPSESNLMRLYYVADAAERFPDSKVVIAHPGGDSTGVKMVKFLVRMGLDPSRISLMQQGHNTREQLIAFSKGAKVDEKCIAIVTSPEHMRRTVMSARRLDMSCLLPVPAFENALFIDLDYDFDKAGGSSFAPDVSGSDRLRYDFWNYLKLEIICLRETIAIGYYWLNDWV